MPGRSGLSTGGGQQLAIPLGDMPALPPPPPGGTHLRRRRVHPGPQAVQVPLPLGIVRRTSLSQRLSDIRAAEDAFYPDVLVLRAAGRHVYRAGRQHLVDGRLLDTPQLLELARSIAPTGRA